MQVKERSLAAVGRASTFRGRMDREQRKPITSRLGHYHSLLGQATNVGRKAFQPGIRASTAEPPEKWTEPAMRRSCSVRTYLRSTSAPHEVPCHADARLDP